MRQKIVVIVVIVILLLMPAISAAETQTGHIESGGADRSYHVYVPSSLDESQPVSLVVALHPFASSGRALEAMTGLDAAADEFGFMVVYPDNLDIYWGDGRVEAGWPPDAESVDDVAFIGDMLDELSVAYPIESIYLTGFRDGGMMAMRLACEMPDRFDALAVVGALLWQYHADACSQGEGTPPRMLYLLSDNDPLYRLEGNQVSLWGDNSPVFDVLSLEATRDFWLERLGCDADSAVTDANVTRYCTDEHELDVAVIKNGGNLWWRSDDRHTLNQTGVDATAIVTRFFMSDDAWQTLAMQTPSEDVYSGHLRSYSLYVPSTDIESDAPLPLVVALHGKSDSGAGMAYQMDLNRIAGENGFIAVYPDGIDNQWNYPENFQYFSPLDYSDVDFLSVLVDDLALDLNIDRERVYVTGFSNGAYMTERLACSSPDVFAAFAVFSAGLVPPMIDVCDSQPPIPILFSHGSQDSVVLWDGMQQEDIVTSMPVLETVSFFAIHNGCSTEGIDHTVLPASSTSSQVHIFTFNDCSPHGNVLFYAINGGGHNLPGTPGRLAAAIAGTVNTDIHAGQIAWDFFSQHTLSEGE